MMAGVFEARLALLGLGVMAALAPWPWPRAERRARRRLEARWPDWRFVWSEGVARGLPPPDRPRRVRWVVPLEAETPQAGFLLRVGGRRAPARAGLGVWPLPRLETTHAGDLVALGRLLTGRLAARLQPGDVLGLEDGWLWWETAGSGDAQTLRSAAAAWTAPPPTDRAVRAALPEPSARVLRAAVVLGHPGAFERRPAARELAPWLLDVAGDRARPRSTRLRALRVAAGGAEASSVVDALVRLVFLVGLDKDGTAEAVLVRALDAAELDAQIAAARALEAMGGPAALGPLSTARAREPEGASALAEATAHARAAIRGRLTVEPEHGTLALADADAGGLAVLRPDDQSRSA